MTNEAAFDTTETLLRDAARDLRYPATPPIAAAVAARLREDGSVPSRGLLGAAQRWWSRPAARLREEGPVRSGGLLGAAQRWWSRPAARLAFAAASVVLLIVGAALAVPQSRTALAELFGLSHVQIEVGPTTGPEAPAVSPDSFARPATLEEARATVGFALKLPAGIEGTIAPDAVYLQGEAEDPYLVILVYEDEGYDLYQTRFGMFGKGVPEPSRETQVAGHSALWIDSGGHVAWFLDGQGRVVVESRRSVERATLFWEDAGVTYRLETSLSEEDAIAVAESLR